MELMKEINVHPGMGGEVVMDEAFAGKTTEDISNFFFFWIYDRRPLSSE